MFEVWKIGVVFTAQSNVAKVLNAHARAAQNANSAVDKQTSALKRYQAASDAYSKAVEKRTRTIQKWAQTGMEVGAAALAAGLMRGLDLAGQLERAMVAVGTATHTSGAALEKIRGQIIQVSGNTAQNPAIIAQEYAKVAESGFFNAATLQRIMPTLALFSDVQMLRNHMNPISAAKYGAEISHYFGAYGGSPEADKRLTDLYNYLNALGKTQPESLAMIARQAKYYANQMHQAGISDATIIALTDVMGQTGYASGRGGTGIQAIKKANDYLSQGMASKAAQAAAKELHLPEYFKKYGSTFNVEALTKWLNSQRKSMSDPKFAALIGKAFGDTARPFLTQLTTDQAQELYRRDKNQVMLATKPGNTLQDDQEKFMNTLFGRWRQFITNFDHILIEVLYPNLPVIEHALKGAADQFQVWAMYLHNHPDLGSTIFKTAVYTFGSLAAAAAVTGLRLAGTFKVFGDTMMLAARRVAAAEALVAAGGVVPVPGIPGRGGNGASRAAQGAEGVARDLSPGARAFAALNEFGKSIGVAGVMVFDALTFGLGRPALKAGRGLLRLIDRVNPLQWAFKAAGNGFWKLASWADKAAVAGGRMSGIFGRLTGALMKVATWAESLAGIPLGGIAAVFAAFNNARNATPDTDLQRAFREWAAKHPGQVYKEGSDANIDALYRKAHPENPYWGWSYDPITGKMRANGQKFAQDRYSRMGPLEPKGTVHVTNSLPTTNNWGGITINMPPGSPHDQGQKFADEIQRLKGVASRRQGAVSSVPGSLHGLLQEFNY